MYKYSEPWYIVDAPLTTKASHRSLCACGLCSGHKLGRHTSVYGVIQLTVKQLNLTQINCN